MAGLLGREEILEALKRDARRFHEEHGDAPKLDTRVQEGIEALRRDSRRFQEQLESLRHGSRRFQEEMDAARRELVPIESLRRGSRRFQELLEAATRAGRRFQADIEAVRRDPYLILLNPRSTLKRRRAAARRVAAAHVIAFKQPAVRKALSEWRRQPAERDRWLRQLFADALVDAAKEAGVPRPRIRLGRRWVKDRQGRVLEHVAPMELSLPGVRRWLLRRAWQMMELAILGDDVASGRRRRRLSRRDRDALGEDHRGVEAMHEYRPTPPAVLRTSRLSKRERQLLDLLWAGVSSPEAAARFGVSLSTIRNLKSRLRAKGWPKM